MPDSFTLITFSLFLILHNVHCVWVVSEPLNQTLNENGSVTVTCMVVGENNFTTEAKLKMNNKYVCVIQTKGENANCEWQRHENSFTFTLNNPEDIYKNNFSCEISRIKPYPVDTKEGPQVKLFQGCTNTVPPRESCLCDKQKDLQDNTRERSLFEDHYPLLICCLIIVLAMTFFYSIFVTVAYIRLKVIKVESSDTLTYVPMQRNVKRHDIDNTEYVDMREVQKRGGSHRDMNHNSHLHHNI